MNLWYDYKFERFRGLFLSLYFLKLCLTALPVGGYAFSFGGFILGHGW